MSTADGPSVVIEVRDLTKDYRGLRPLRIRRLELHRGQALALLGFDRASAEVMVNLLTGATVPDTGEVRIFGQPTTDIPDSDAWLRSLDRFGLLSERAVLLDGLTAAQNLAMPLTLEIDALPDSVRSRVAQLASDVGLQREDLDQRVGALSPAARQRLRLARAVALGPQVLLAEHPNAAVPEEDLPGFAADFAQLVARRGMAALTLTADRTFAAAVSEQVLTLQPATGELKPAASGWRRWFS